MSRAGRVLPCLSVQTRGGKPTGQGNGFALSQRLQGRAHSGLKTDHIHDQRFAIATGGQHFGHGKGLACLVDALFRRPKKLSGNKSTDHEISNWGNKNGARQVDPERV